MDKPIERFGKPHFGLDLQRSLHTRVNMKVENGSRLFIYNYWDGGARIEIRHSQAKKTSIRMSDEEFLLLKEYIAEM